MPDVKVTRDIPIKATDATVVSYSAGYEGPAPDDHIERIVAAGCGVRLTTRDDERARLGIAQIGDLVVTAGPDKF
ncbi:hypothetical protein SAMN05519104_6671 [Rhizobiales bacterium GAS188]|nr:hypothetical protein SAMN05519104_6671 [Rhizobiales bacterium GAS188]